MLDLAYLNSGAVDGARDADADFNGVVDIEDLVFIDSDWGESLHTGDKKFIGSDQMNWGDLSSSEDGAAWTDRSFQDQNAIEVADDFQVLLGLDVMGDSDLEIESDYFQENVLEVADIP